MFESEYYQWRSDIVTMLQCKYTEEQANIIANWFDRIKCADECDLIGEESVKALSNIVNNSLAEKGVWNLYNSLTARVWLYADLILKNEN